MRKHLHRGAYLPFLLFFFTATAAQAQEIWERAPRTPIVGYTVVDHGLDSQALVDALFAVAEDRPTRLVPRPITPEKIDEVDDRFAERARSAQRSFFFDDPDTTLAANIPIFEPSLLRTNQWRGSSERSELVLTAGLFAVRVHLQEHRTDHALALLNDLIALFPAHTADQRVFPPEIVELWDRSRARLEDSPQGIPLRLGPLLSNSSCSIAVNGARVSEDPMVVRDRYYLISQTCDDGTRNYRWISTAADEVSLSSLEWTLSHPDLHDQLHRLLTARYIRAIIVIGRGCADDPDELCVGRFDRSGWDVSPTPVSSADDPASLLRIVEGETARAPEPIDELHQPPGSSLIPAIAFSTSGTLATTAGVLWLADLRRRELALDCASNSAFSPDPEACIDREPRWIPDPAERQHYRDRLVLGRLGAIATIGTGATLLVLGAFSLHDYRRPRITLHPSGVAITVPL